MDLVEFYLREHTRIFTSLSSDTMIDRADILLSWLRKEKITMIYPEMVYKRGPQKYFRKREDAMMALATLDEHGYLLKLDKGTVVEGKARRMAWRLV